MVAPTDSTAKLTSLNVKAANEAHTIPTKIVSEKPETKNVEKNTTTVAANTLERSVSTAPGDDQIPWDEELSWHYTKASGPETFPKMGTTLSRTQSTATETVNTTITNVLNPVKETTTQK
jgi:hypothetical protein